ncbi:MAG: type III pantothenate kinase [Bacteroidota bacterium]
MILTLDIGNSRIKSAVFGQSGDLNLTDAWSVDDWSGIAKYATNQNIRFIIFSTVANEPPKAWLTELQKSGIRCEALTHKSPLPFHSQYRTMNTLGRDRIAALAGAIELLPGVDCLIADMGTCLTLDVLLQTETARASLGRSSTGKFPLFIGGNISPGLRMRLGAMHEGTQRLPLVSIQPLDQMLGLDTESALQHGGLGGMIYEIEGLFSRLCAKFPDLRLLITGGDAKIVQEHLKSTSLFQPHLVHYGLYQISTLYAA